jgi:serine/threonine protein kinase/WD40 repeat protein/Flp pilus assembly protein TadD
MTDSGATDDRLLELAQEFADRHRRGERPSLTEYAKKNPEFADEIRDLFPAMLMMEEFGSVAGQAGAGPLSTDSDMPLQLGEYRILREVARGGMGIVYEAVQESLGRHVAVKVLPFQRVLHGHYLERFRREARAAARLHHSNIVPVFGVGEHEGIHYYAMQFIQGQTLDTVLHELRRLRRARPDRGGNRRGGSAEHPPERQNPDLSASLAAGLAVGQFLARVEEPPASPAPGRVSDSTATSGSGVGSGTHSQLGAQSDWPYFRSVAQIGNQVAEALAYAHQQGVLHRDVKPSNLLLDTRGVVWVTDFGLAKADGSDELTSPSELVGTLRYMAPERFRGQADPRSDVYSLGLTLYELATLQPAYAESERAKQVDRILHDDPAPPRKVDAHVPRDLETIILRSIAKDPDRRYQSAAQLADDLRRFLGDRPIRARRTTAWERGWRWCRRNPVQAALIVSVSILLAVLSGGLFVNYLLREERDNAIAAEQKANELLERAQSAEREVQILSHLARASAHRRSRQRGQRFAALDELAQAMRLDPSPQLRRELRNEAIACLALPDIRPAREWVGWPAGSAQLDFDESLETYARADYEGNVTICRTADGSEIVRSTGFGGGETWPRLSPDGRYVALFDGGKRVKVWDVRDPSGPPFLEESSCLLPDFSFDSTRIAYGCEDGSIVVRSLAPMRPAQRLALGALPRGMAFSPLDARLAVSADRGIRIFDVQSGAAVDLPHNFPFERLAWHPEGSYLAAVSQDERRIIVWDVAARRPIAQLEGYKNGGVHLAFDASGDLLASTGWEGMLRFWEFRSGKQLFRTPGDWRCLRFGAKNPLLAAETQLGRPELRLHSVTPGREYRTLLHASAPSDGIAEYYAGSIDPHGRMLAVAMRDGVRIWSLDSGDEIGFLRLGFVGGVWFLASGALLTHGPAGLLEWPVQADRASSHVIRLGPPRSFRLTGNVGPIIASSDGRLLACSDANGTLVMDRDRSHTLIRLVPEEDVGSIAFSPDGQFLATGSHRGPGAKVWDSKTGKLLKDLPVGIMCPVAFSPDGRWLATSGGGCRFWKVGSWEEGPFVGGQSHLAFSPDGKLLATETGSGGVRLVDPETGEDLARFEDPNQDRATWLAFTPDGARLVTTNTDSGSIHVWDLQSIRRGLAELGLDWKPAPVARTVPSRSAKPVELKIDLGGLEGAGLAATGQWDQAARAYERAIERNPDEWSLWYDRVMLHVAYGDREGYRRAGTRALDRFGNAREAEIVAWMAWACVAWPDEETDAARLVELARQAWTADPKSYVYARVLGATLLRAGRAEEAARILGESLELKSQSPTTWLLLALAHHRLGHRDEARTWLDRAARRIDAVLPEVMDPGRAGGLPWTDRLVLRRLRAEAEAALAPPSTRSRDPD